MLDVHPPHHPTHTWKDFFIHIATISVGLLIAIGLEQTVEAIHHAGERRELISELREEADGNVTTLRRDINVLLSEAEWDISAIAALQSAPSKGGIVSVTLPKHKPFGHNSQPNRSVWTIATGNGRAALLPEARAHAYELMDRGATQVLTATESRNIASVALHQLELQLQTAFFPGAALAIPEKDRPAAIQNLAAHASALQYEAERDAVLTGYCDATVHDIFDQSNVGQILGKEATAVQDRIDRSR
jgi:hypothetical protein